MYIFCGYLIQSTSDTNHLYHSKLEGIKQLKWKRVNYSHKVTSFLPNYTVMTL